MLTIVLHLLNHNEPFSLGEWKEWVQIIISKNLDEGDSDSNEDDSDFAVVNPEDTKDLSSYVVTTNLQSGYMSDQ